MERMMDRIARELQIDRAEVRRRNFIQPNQMPYNVGLTFRDGKPAIYDSGDYPKSQQIALDHFDYAGFEERRKAALRGGRYIGIGISNAVEGTGLGPYEVRRSVFQRVERLLSIRGQHRRVSHIKRPWRRLQRIISAYLMMISAL
jgi:carbon-monoxide dehydrogenase large subunit